MKTHLDLFSGIGGFALACRWVGIKTVQFVEIDEFCQKVLKKNFKGVPIHEDIKSFRADGIVSPFLLTGGWPCQPFSQAGKRLGKADPRHLWPEMLRITRECRPTWILGENVSGHIKLGLEEVLTDLEGEGYDSQVFHIGAVAKDAPHRRMRLWIVAHSNSGLGNRERKEICTGRNSPDNGSKVVADSDSKRRCLRKTNREDAEDVGEPSRCEENWEGELESRLGGTLHDGVSERLDQDWWIDEPLDIPRVGEKIPDRVKRLKAIGNAIVPKLAYEIIRWMR